MYDIFRENRCPQCPFRGQDFATQINGVRLVECLRDNEESKERFKHHTENKDILTWIRQEGEFLHCLYWE